MCHISSPNAPQQASLSLSLCLSLCLRSLGPPWALVEFGWCAPRGGAEGGAHLVSVLYESDVYVCNCGYGWLNSRCPSGSPGSYQSVSGLATQRRFQSSHRLVDVSVPHMLPLHITAVLRSWSVHQLNVPLSSLWNVRGKKKTFSLQFSRSIKQQS